MKSKKYLIFPLLIYVCLLTSTCLAANEFNELFLQKLELEDRFGIKWLECFPFTENIGFMEDQALLVRNCLTGAKTFKEALADVPDADIQTVGIRTRFLRSNGFNTVTIPWNATKDELVAYLRQRPSKEEQNRFLEKVLALKQQIQRKLNGKEIYCSQRISNEQCFDGYKTLAEGLSTASPQKDTRWNKIVISEAGSHDDDDPVILLLKYDSPASVMLEALYQSDPEKVWSVRKKTYEKIQEKYGDTFINKLNLPNFFCDPALSTDECFRGATNFYVAALDDSMRNKAWGEVFIDKYNTWIANDFDTRIRHDLPPQKIISYFAGKPSTEEVRANSVLAESLEEQTKRNSTGLRAVCDLRDLRSSFCVAGLKTFMEFVKNHRSYRAGKPWTELMFVDGNQLSRVNFALNSPVRRSYIYIDANSTPEELETHIIRFAGEKNTDIP